MSDRQRRMGRGLIGLAVWGLAADAVAGWEVNLPRGVTPVSGEVYDLHMLIFWICVAIGMVVFGAMFWAMLRHRKSRGQQAAHFHHSTRAEVVWTVAPFLILVSMAIPATRALILMEDTSSADLTIKVTGYQWKWHYDYLDEDVRFYSNLASTSQSAMYTGKAEEVDNYLLEVDKEVVIPAGKKVRLLITAADVIHAWWVPEFGMKKDAIPGFINEMWVQAEEPGVYRGQCAELCGAYHGYMPIVVEVKPEDEYRQWVASQKQAAAADGSAERTATLPESTEERS